MCVRFNYPFILPQQHLLAGTMTLPSNPRPFAEVPYLKVTLAVPPSVMLPTSPSMFSRVCCTVISVGKVLSALYAHAFIPLPPPLLHFHISTFPHSHIYFSPEYLTLSRPSFLFTVTHLTITHPSPNLPSTWSSKQKSTHPSYPHPPTDIQIPPQYTPSSPLSSQGYKPNDT